MTSSSTNPSVTSTGSSKWAPLMVRTLPEQSGVAAMISSCWSPLLVAPAVAKVNATGSSAPAMTTARWTGDGWNLRVGRGVPSAVGCPGDRWLASCLVAGPITMRSSFSMTTAARGRRHAHAAVHGPLPGWERRRTLDDRSAGEPSAAGFASSAQSTCEPHDLINGCCESTDCRGNAQDISEGQPCATTTPVARPGRGPHCCCWRTTSAIDFLDRCGV